MNCPNCDAVVAEGVQFCPNCGNDLLSNSTEPGKSPSKKPKKKLNFKIIFVGIIVVFIIVAIIIILSVFSGNKGEKIAENLSDNIGKSIAMTEKNVHIELSETSDYSILKSIVDYDYVIEADSSIKVEGINLPKWAVFVEKDSNDKTEKVTYYDFKVLEKDWKGVKSSKLIDTNTIEYGMNTKEVEKLIPIKPLAIVRTNDDTTEYIYKYYFTDEKDKNEKAYYFKVDFDIDNNVKNITSKENDYVSFIFK